jgi:hypothetical protein
MAEIIIMYSGNTVFYEKDKSISFDYIADIGVHFINFIEKESKITPYSYFSEYENSEKSREYFGGLLSTLMCEGITFKDLNGNIEKPPFAIELLSHSNRFKETFEVKHFVFPKTDGSYEIRTGYVISSLYDALYIELIKLIESGKLIKRCEHCNRLFFPKDRSEKYCDRLAENEKTCKDVGYIRKVENDELLKAYNTSYKTRHAEKQRKTRNKSASTIKKYNETLELWREKARELLHKAQDEKTEESIDEFKRFLNTSLEHLIN